MPNLLDKFKKFVSDCGYELVVSDTGISVEELAESFETGSDDLFHSELTIKDSGITVEVIPNRIEVNDEEKTNIIP